MKNVMRLKAASKHSGELSSFNSEEASWEEIQQWIRRVFEFGGTVTLTIGVREDVDRLLLGDSLAMYSHPGECRLVYDPVTSPTEKTARREWWEPGDEPFRGTTSFMDHEWDDRTVCRDISVALEMFRDFYEHQSLTEVSLKQTRSVWDRKAR
ncbi:DUF6911 family protein [Burkholderia vietnamiensis]|uniref:DUF6911 family protein n=1 Tax=Burkholderia vietnamiensis TaxID=60552 RepID=UPI0012D8A2A2|nr:hypothetical protein [Burkholderia vietnamiensis]